MEGIAANVEALHFGVADLDAFFVGPRIECALDFEAGFGCCSRNQFDHRGMIGEWPGAPILRDAAEQAMLDLIPFRRAWRVMPDFDGKPRFVRELL